MEDYGPECRTDWKRPCAYDTRKVVIDRKEYEQSKEEEYVPPNPFVVSALMLLAILPGMIIALERMYGVLR